MVVIMIAAWNLKVLRSCLYWYQGYNKYLPKYYLNTFTYPRLKQQPSSQVDTSDNCVITLQGWSRWQLNQNQSKNNYWVKRGNFVTHYYWEFWGIHKLDVALSKLMLIFTFNSCHSLMQMSRLIKVLVLWLHASWGYVNYKDKCIFIWVWTI